MTSQDWLYGAPLVMYMVDPITHYWNSIEQSQFFVIRASPMAGKEIKLSSLDNVILQVVSFFSRLGPGTPKMGLCEVAIVLGVDMQHLKTIHQILLVKYGSGPQHIN